MSEQLELQGRTDRAIGLRTLAKFLLGDRDAILTIASASPSVLGVGALFVVSAALAREYDGADLLAEPWHLALPLAASLGTSFLLFCLLFSVGKLRGIGAVPFGRSYLRFLGLYWMTAPLAWLYAIPVEQFMMSLGSTQANLALLGLVSVWRVWLMIRVAQVLFGAGPAAAFSLVLFFADAVAFAAIVAMPKPVISMMGGIRHTASEDLVSAASFLVGAACVVCFPFLLIASATIATSRSIRWNFAFTLWTPTSQLGVGLQSLSVASVAIWALVLPMTQPQQHLARRVDLDLEAGRIAEAVRVMADHKRSDFPARWDPPPHVGYGDRTPPIVDVMEVVLATKPPEWVRKIFVQKFGNMVFDPAKVWQRSSDDNEFHRCVEVLLKLPEGPQIAAREQHWLKGSYDRTEESSPRRAEIQALLDLAKTHDAKRSSEESSRLD